MTWDPGSETAGISEVVAAVVEQVFATVDRVHEATVRALGDGSDSLAGAIDSTVRELLLAPSQLATGLGVILGPDSVRALCHPADHRAGAREAVAPQQFRWWQVDPSAGSLQLLTPDLRPSSLGFYDYLSADWFEVPRRTGRRHVVGPYIDLNGTGQYLLTLTGPVTVGGRFVGVVGADVPVRRLEAHLMSASDAAPSGYALLNDERRIVLSTSPRWFVGALADVRRHDGTGLRGTGLRGTGHLSAGHPVAGVPWTLHATDTI